MALSTDDMKYLGKQFEGIKTAAEGVKIKLDDHIKNPCPNMTKHWKSDHKGALGRVVIILATGLGAILTLLGILKYFT